MNPRAKLFDPRLLLAVLIAGCAALASFAQPEPVAKSPPPAASTQTSTNAPAAVPAIPQSVFIVPTTDGEGRDPFFPDDLLQAAPTPGQAPAAPTTVDLSLQGFSGQGGHRLAIINEESFAAGEEGFVSTSAGRISIRCIELKTNSVIVQVGGERRELRFQPDQ